MNEEEEKKQEEKPEEEIPINKVRPKNQGGGTVRRWDSISYEVPPEDDHSESD